MRKSSILKILNNWKNPIFIRNAILYKIASILNKKKKGFCIFDEEWDNLIILDACRYDIFKSEYKKREMKGKLLLKKSRGSHTTTFLLNNFFKDKYDDVVYITGNPYVDKLIKNKLHKVISVWKDGWNEKYRTALPETMYQYAIDAIINYPNKKLIIHFMQPHYPYIGYNIGGVTIKPLRDMILDNSRSKRKRKYKDKLFSLYGIDLYAMINRKTHLKLYRKNLEIVLPYVEKLIDFLPGKTIVSADHGESIGDFLHPLIPIRLYGHNKNFLISGLINVPWLIINEEEKDFKELYKLDERRKIQNTIRSLNI